MMVNADKTQELYQYIKSHNISLDAVELPSDNIFSVLDIAGKEVPYCKVLLFLIRNEWVSFEKDVLNNCCDGEPLEIAENEHPCTSPCSVYGKEGRIDIFLETQNHVVAIEAKVYASDQEYQLARYHKELENKFPCKKKHIFYLTVEGRTPSDETTKCGRCDAGCSAQNVVAISWNKNISDWIKKHFDETQSNNIPRQFLEVLQSERKKQQQMNEYINILESNAEYTHMVFSLSKSLPEFWRQIRKCFFDSLAEALEKDHGFCIVKSEEEKHGDEIRVITLSKNKQFLYLCYEDNLYVRIQDGWKYIERCSFSEKHTAKMSENKSNAVNMLYFQYDESKQCNKDVVNWYCIRNEDSGKRIISAISDSVNKFFENV